MFRLLDKMRQKPEPERRFYAIVITVVLTAAVFGIWLSVITTKGLGDSAQVSGTGAGEKEQVQQTSPFETLQQNVKRMYGDFKGIIGDFQEAGEKIEKAGQESTGAGR